MAAHFLVMMVVASARYAGSDMEKGELQGSNDREKAEFKEVFQKGNFIKERAEGRAGQRDEKGEWAARKGREGFEGEGKPGMMPGLRVALVSEEGNEALAETFRSMRSLSKALKEKKGSEAKKILKQQTASFARFTQAADAVVATLGE